MALVGTDKDMSFYIGREASKLWKRFCAEVTTEINLLAENWKYLLGGLICQYIHGLTARGCITFHRPGPILQDDGFYLLPELGQDRAYISETVFTTIFLSFVLWTFSILFIFKTKKIYTVLIWCRVLAFLVECLLFARITFFLLIIASRKRYTVSVVVAWYTVNLVVFFIDKTLPELPDRTSALLLPVTKDSKSKEENHKLLNGNSEILQEWAWQRRPRTQINGKIVEDGKTVHEAVINGA
ncbi:hypothetical protein HAX54_049800 [Datura stramonium]|uniref:Uncharacterized protein n=1 Tax=Datura stramonium TaxID=4076 RepID=A0ABS8WPM4_DATST|nr:hypothetical protein [Datura stramonium]